MDFESLGEELVNDTFEESDIYVKFKDSVEFHSIQKTDLEKAKGFLSTVHPKLNISLYDHLADVLQSILRSKIPNAVEKFEELSLHLKKVRQASDNDLTEVFEIGEELEEFLKEKQIFYKFPASAPDISQTIKTSEEDEDEDSDEDETDVQEAESEEQLIGNDQDLSEVLPDVPYIMNRFRQAGIGLSEEEIYELTVALKDLALQFKLRKVRFWGKVLGIKSDYYIAEAPYQEGVVQENFGWEAERITEASPVGEEDLEEKENEDEEEEAKVDEASDEEQTDEPETMKIPPVPEPKSKERKAIPPEENGTGVNEYVYFACPKLGEIWRVLPFMTPSQVSEARYFKRFFTGDLESQIKGCMSYPGKEAHYLRAQIARITASTYIAPSDYYKLAGEEDEDDENEEKQEGDNNGIVINSEFMFRPSKYFYSNGLSAWVHYKRAVLHQGRCIPMKLEKNEDDNEDDKDNDEEDEEKEEEEPEILEAIVETEVPLLRTLSEDRAIGRLIPWAMKLSSTLTEETAVLILYSALWPGAYTFYDGKTFEHVYIGYGYKYSVFHYAPPIRVSWHNEYDAGDVIEHVDEEIFPTDQVDEEEATGAEEENENDVDEKDEDESEDD